MEKLSMAANVDQDQNHSNESIVLNYGRHGFFLGNVYRRFNYLLVLRLLLCMLFQKLSSLCPGLGVLHYFHCAVSIVGFSSLCKGFFLSSLHCIRFRICCIFHYCCWHIIDIISIVNMIIIIFHQYHSICVNNWCSFP